MGNPETATKGDEKLTLKTITNNRRKYQTHTQYRVKERSSIYGPFTTVLDAFAKGGQEG